MAITPEMVGSLGQVLVGAGALVISLYLLLHERRAARVSTHEAMLRSWNELIRFGLQDEKHLTVLGELLYPGRKDDPQKLRQYLTSLTVFNALEQLIVAKRYKGIDAGLADSILEVLLRSFLQHPTARDVLNRGTLDPDLLVFAKAVRDKLDEEARAAAAKPGGS